MTAPSLYRQLTDAILNAPRASVGMALDIIEGTISQAYQDGFGHEVVPRLGGASNEPMRTVVTLLNVLAGHTIGESIAVMWQLRREVTHILRLRVPPHEHPERCT